MLLRILDDADRRRRAPDDGRAEPELPQLIGQQAEHDRVSAAALERHVRAKKTFAREPATRSDTLIMEDCVVPREAVLDPPVPSLPDFLRDTDAIVNIPYTAVYLGIGVGAFGAAIAAVKDRVPKGYSRPIAYQPEIRRRVALMSAQLEAARRLLHYAAWLVDTGAPPAEALAAFLKAKYVVGETVADVTRSALEMGGAHATFRGSLLERFFRDGATATIMPPPSDHCLTQLGISELGLDPAEVLSTLR